MLFAKLNSLSKLLGYLTFFSPSLALQHNVLPNYNYNCQNHNRIATSLENMTAIVGNPVVLKCEVPGSHTKKIVSWGRQDKFKLLTVGASTFTRDKRFYPIYLPDCNKWALQIQYPQLNDSGLYECRTNDFPTLRQFIRLFVQAPKIQILGSPIIYFRERSTINLTCLIMYSPNSGHEVKWTFNKMYIKFNPPKNVINVFTKTDEQMSLSNLLVLNATLADDGVYTCAQTKYISQSIIVNLEKDDDIENGGTKRYSILGFPLTTMFLCLIFVLVEMT